MLRYYGVIFLCIRVYYGVIFLCIRVYVMARGQGDGIRSAGGPGLRFVIVISQRFSVIAAFKGIEMKRVMLEMLTTPLPKSFFMAWFPRPPTIQKSVDHPKKMSKVLTFLYPNLIICPDVIFLDFILAPPNWDTVRIAH